LSESELASVACFVAREEEGGCTRESGNGITIVFAVSAPHLISTVVALKGHVVAGLFFLIEMS
jgi:hypothetical protein